MDVSTPIEATSTKKLLLYSGTAHPELAEEIAGKLAVGLGNPNLRRFANGEMHCRFDESIRGADVFIIQTHGGVNVNDALMEQLIMIDAAKRASAKRITAVCPCYAYARQDRKAEGREPITAKLVADLLTVAGADRVVSVDLHTGQIQGFFDGPVDHLTAVPLLADHLATQIEGDVVVIDKRRPKGTHNVAEATEVVGNVAGNVCILIDDMIDTAGTVVSAANLLVERGATEVWVLATHGVLSGPAVDRLKNAPVRGVVVTN